jgi:hypothetical protein
VCYNLSIGIYVVTKLANGIALSASIHQFLDSATEDIKPVFRHRQGYHLHTAPDEVVDVILEAAHETLVS